MRRSSFLIAAGGSFVVLVGTLALVPPIVVDAQVSSVNRALQQMAKHQATIDSAFQQFLGRNTSGGSEPDDRLLAQSSANLAQYESARSLIEADRTALLTALPGLPGVIAPEKRDAILSARHRQAPALVGLVHAEDVLTAAIDQERLQQGFFFASVTEAKMLTAIGDQQYVQIDAMYAQADRGLRVSETLMSHANESPGFRPAIVAMRSIIDQTQKYAAALLRNDKTDADARHAAMREGYAALASATNAAAITANDDWNDHTYQPLIAAYHSALAAALAQVV